jgi:hypothetical protein
MNETQTNTPKAGKERTARRLVDFLGKHRGETAWMFGKGPSLDGFDMALAGPLRCAINDVVKVVPGCVYCFARDPVAAWAHHYRPEHVLFQPAAIQGDIHARKADVPCERIWFADERDGWPERLAWPAERMAEEGLAVLAGTLCSAEQILRIMGVARIMCVGIDGGGQHASRERWDTRLRADHSTDYNNIRNDFLLACSVHGIELAFFDAASRTFTNGMKTVRILSNTFCRGQPLFAGQVIDLLPLDADALMAAGRAVIEKKAAIEPTAAPPAKVSEGNKGPEIETAALAPGGETPERGRRRVRKLKA